MRSLGLMSILSVVAVPALGGAVTYTFDVTQGDMTFSLRGGGSSSGAMTGTFSVTIYRSDGHIGESDTFVLEDCDLVNSESVAVDLVAGTLTANLYAGSARFLDLMPDGAAHIGAGGQGAVDADIFSDVVIYVSGLGMTSPIHVSTWIGGLEPFGMTISTSQSSSDVVTAKLSGALVLYEFVLSEVITLDLAFTVEGTAHAAPDPTLGGLITLGLGVAGIRLRRRRA